MGIMVRGDDANEEVPEDYRASALLLLCPTVEALMRMHHINRAFVSESCGHPWKFAQKTNGYPCSNGATWDIVVTFSQ